jgi:membrane-associated HD superfamily phosphohydrolase
MKDLVLLSVFGSGGVGVLISYYLLYLTGNLQKYVHYFTKVEWRVWIFSAFLTVASVIGLIIWFSFYQKLQESERILFIVSLAIFLIFAKLWSVSLAYIKARNASPYIQRPILLVVALATIGLLLATVYSTDKWLVISAAAIIVFHHLFFDAFYWMHIVDRETRKDKNLKVNNLSVKHKALPRKSRNV